MPEQGFSEFNRAQNEGVSMKSAPEILEAAEPLYEALPTDLVDVNCGDGRRPVVDLRDLYAKKFGGGIGYSWDYMVLMELLRPGSVTQPLLDVHADQVNDGSFKRAGLVPGVHSDQQAEGARAVTIDLYKTVGKVGCGRWEHGVEISQIIVVEFEPIYAKGLELAPQVFSNKKERAHSLASINDEMSRRKTSDGRLFLPNGREIVVGAVEAGATGIVLGGEHVEEDAVYSLVEDQTNNNQKDQRHFGADGWASLRFFAANNHDNLFNPNDVLLQDIMISLATKLVLTGSLDEVAVRS